MKKGPLLSLAVFLAFVSVNIASAKIVKQVELRVAATKEIATHFLTNQSLYVDSSDIFAAGTSGQLWVFKNELPYFPLEAVISISSQALRSVRGDEHHIYVTSDDGSLYEYEKQSFQFVRATPISAIGLTSLQVDPGPTGAVLVAQGQSRMAANSKYAAISELNQAETALELSKKTFSREHIYGENFVASTTQVFERDGELLGSVSNPLNLFGQNGQVNLYFKNRILALTMPGCCGPGVILYEINENRKGSASIKQVGSINQPFANVVSMTENKLALGTESDIISLYEAHNIDTLTLLATINLQQVEGFNEEIRSISLREFDDVLLIYALGSGGHLFILRVEKQ